MSTPQPTAGAALPTSPPCWPNDPDYLDGRKELRLPTGLMRAHWDTDILDVHGVPPSTIISIHDEFDVRFRIELVGGAWQCIAGDWAFDLGFDPIGAGNGFNLSDHLPPGTLQVKNWKGCERLCIELTAHVPAGTIPAGTYTGSVYEVAAMFQLHCCGKPAPVVGYEPLEEYQFYQP